MLSRWLLRSGFSARRYRSQTGATGIPLGDGGERPSFVCEERLGGDPGAAVFTAAFPRPV